MQRKFNASRFFDSFQGHEEELANLFTRFNKTLPTPFTTETAARAACEDFKTSDPMTILLHQLNDLATPKGRDIIRGAIDSFAIPGPGPKGNMTHHRAALWLWNADQSAFESAMDRLAASGTQGGLISIFPGKSAQVIDDESAAMAGFESRLNANIGAWKGAERFTIRHYRDGAMLVILVFCERNAEASWEMVAGSNTIKTRITRPVIQDVLFYDQSTGDLEIEASHGNQREVLRKSFAEGVMGDESFFPIEAQARVLDLQKLIEMNFKLPVRAGHHAQITGVTLKETNLRTPFTVTISANRQDVIEILHTKNAGGLLENARIDSVRIELILGTGHLDRKSIELTGENRIKFNRASHADEINRYLHQWTLMGNRVVEKQSAA